MTILFVAFMALLIPFAPEKFYYFFVLIFGVAVQMGYQVGLFGLAVWMGLTKVAHDIFYAGKRS